MSRLVAEQASEFLTSDRYFSCLWVVILATYVVLFILGDCLLDSYQLILIFIEVLLYNFHLSR